MRISASCGRRAWTSTSLSRTGDFDRSLRLQSQRNLCRRVAAATRWRPLHRGGRPQRGRRHSTLAPLRHVGLELWAWGATLAQVFSSGYTEVNPSPANNERRVGTYDIWNLQGTYGGLKNTMVTLGIKNLFDRAPPFSNQSCAGPGDVRSPIRRSAWTSVLREGRFRVPLSAVREPRSVSMLTRRRLPVAHDAGSRRSRWAHARRNRQEDRARRYRCLEPTSSDEGRGRNEFVEELRDRGWVEGQNIVFERRYFHGDRARLPGLMAELIALDVDVICAQARVGGACGERATDRIPIVFTVGDAVGRGVVPISRGRREMQLACPTGTSNQWPSASNC